jgi:hypothetical protein
MGLPMHRAENEVIAAMPAPKIKLIFLTLLR